MKPASIVLAALLVGVSSCGDSEPAADAPATLTPTTVSASVPEPPPEVDGHEYLSTDVAGHRLVAGSQIRLSFDADQLGASAGCNQLGGTWSLDGDVLVVPDAMAMTEMACDPPALMDQDTWLASFLTSRPTVGLDGDTLTLTSGNVAVALLDREVAEPDRPLEGTKWVVDGLVSADAVSSVPSDIRVPTVRFEGGQVSADLGCNSGGGRFRVSGNEITVTEFNQTMMACGEPADSVERHVADVLAGSSTYAIDADTLTLTNGDSGLVLRATQ